MLNAIALDDEEHALQLLSWMCEEVNFINLKAIFTKPSEANKFIKKFPIDLIFLDINMPDINGIDFFKNLGQECMVIFTTAYGEFAFEAFNVNAIDYLQKPLQQNRFLKACEKAKDYFEYNQNKDTQESKYLYIRAEYALVKILFSEIVYMQTLDDYIKIHIQGKKPIMTLMSMKKMAERLPESEFVRIHQSYIVSIHKIESVRAKTISLGFVDLPLGASFEKQFNQKYMKDYI
jgi:DNA-binding LytR/AlgR family response regulator